MTNHPNEIPGNDTPLDSWKEIAAYVQRDVSTAMRWEKSEGLPVHRHQHSSRASVYAFASELDAWKAAREPQPGESRPWRRWVPALAGGLALLAVAAFIQWGPIMNPPAPLAEAANVGGGITLRQVWADPGSDSFGSVSSDGRYLSFTDWDTGDLAVRDLTTGENRRLTNKGTWSDNRSYAEFSVIAPNGEQVVYAWFNDDDRLYELRIIETRGEVANNKPRVLYRHEEAVWFMPFAWLPNGEKIVVLLQRKDRTNQIVLVSAAEGSVETLKTLGWNYPGGIAVSPNGRYLAYGYQPADLETTRDIYLLAVDGSREIPLVEHPSNDEVIGWTPDGSGVLFTSDRSGQVDVWMLPVVEGRAQGPSRLVKSDLPIHSTMGFASDGSLYYIVRTGMRDVYVAEIDFSTGKLLKAATTPTQRYVGWTEGAAWSPDGKYLAFKSRRGPRNFGGIIVQSVETGVEREIRPRLSYLNRPRWSPDGRFFLTHGTDNKGRSGLYRIVVENGSYEKLSMPVNGAGVFIRSPQFGLDSETLYYLREDNSTRGNAIRVRDLKSGTEKEIFREDGSWQRFRFMLSPDRRQMVIRARERKGAANLLLTMSAEGGKPRELFRLQAPNELGRWAAWTPDGSQILFTVRRDSTNSDELWRIPATGGEAKKTELSEKRIRHPFGVHLDGKRFVYSGGQDQWEIWAMENFLPEMRAAK